jgi:polyisoprenoid-binding protein YceI
MVVETVSVNTGDNERGSRLRARDEHLRTPDFFNVAEFPQMAFKGAATRWNGDAPAAIEDMEAPPALSLWHKTTSGWPARAGT